MNQLIKVIRRGMIETGRKDSAKFLAEILGCTPQNASNKLSGKTPFKDYEIGLIIDALHIPDCELAEALRDI